MKVIVEIEMPACCRACAFFYPGKRYNRCFFPERESKLFFEGDTLPPDCPLKQCKVIEEEENHD